MVVGEHLSDGERSLLEPSVAAAVEELRHFWDGSEPGWELVTPYHCDLEVVYRFDPGGPTTQEALRLRGCREELRDLPMVDVLDRVRGRAEYVAPQIASNPEGHSLKEQGERLGLRVELRAINRSGSLPLRNGMYEVIEDDAVAAEVVRRMRAAGVPESVVEVD